jgi:hypothetical protein
MRLTLLFALAATSVLAQEGGNLTLGVGTQKVLTIPNIQRVAVGDSAICDVKTIGNNQLLVIGAGKGQTTLLVWLSTGVRQSYLVSVVGSNGSAPAYEEIATLVDDGVELQKGQLETYRASGITAIQAADATVLEAKLSGGKLLLRGKAVGRSDLILSRGKLPALQVTVRVSASEEAGETAGLTVSGVELRVGQTVTLAINGLTAVSSNTGQLVQAAAAPGRLTLTGKAVGQANVLLTVEHSDLPIYVRILPAVRE